MSKSLPTYDVIMGLLKNGHTGDIIEELQGADVTGLYTPDLQQVEALRKWHAKSDFSVRIRHGFAELGDVNILQLAILCLAYREAEQLIEAYPQLVNARTSSGNSTFFIFSRWAHDPYSGTGPYELYQQLVAADARFSEEEELKWWDIANVLLFAAEVEDASGRPWDKIQAWWALAAGEWGMIEDSVEIDFQTPFYVGGRLVKPEDAVEFHLNENGMSGNAAVSSRKAALSWGIPVRIALGWTLKAKWEIREAPAPQ